MLQQRVSQVSHSDIFWCPGSPEVHDHILFCVLNATAMQSFYAHSVESVGLSVDRNQSLLQLHSFAQIHIGCESIFKFVTLNIFQRRSCQWFRATPTHPLCTCIGMSSSNLYFYFFMLQRATYIWNVSVKALYKIIPFLAEAFLRM